ncbi:MAG: response regulator, partial [Candidatus Cloacimonetes bacterium]|nr:response regulator [Candidatus Cloacimonadota bacterium]
QKKVQLHDLWEKTCVNGSLHESLNELHIILHNLSGTGTSFGFARLTRQARVIEQLIDSILKKEIELNNEQKDQINILVFKLLEELENPKEQADGFLSQVRKGDGGNLIFIVDDDEYFSQKISVDLEAAGYHTMSFSKPEDIFDTPKKPSAILMDMLFSGCEDNGAHIISRYHDKFDDELSIIFVSVCDDLDSRLQAVRCGADYYLQKPINMLHLLHVLDICVHPRRDNPLTVMIVDDDEIILSYYKLTLSSASLDVHTVTKPLESLKTLKSIDPDLIMLDLHMPECSGLELAQIIRQDLNYLSVPILFLTSESSIEQKHIAIDFGADDYLIKPVTPEYLVKMVISRANRYRKFKELSYALKVSNNRNECIINTLADLVWSAEAKTWKLEFISPSVEEMLGISREEILSDPYNWRNFIYINDVDGVCAELEKLKESDSIDLRYRILRKDNSIRLVSEKIYQILDGKGNLIRFDGIIHDITNQEADKHNIKHKLLVESEISAFTKHLLQYNDEQSAYASLLRLFEAKHIQVFHRIPPNSNRPDLYEVGSVGDLDELCDRALVSDNFTELLSSLSQKKIIQHRYFNFKLPETLINTSIPIFLGDLFWGFVNLIGIPSDKSNSEDEAILAAVCDILSYFYERQKRLVEQEIQNRLLKLSSSLSARFLTDENLNLVLIETRRQLKQAVDYNYVFFLKKIKNTITNNIEYRVTFASSTIEGEEDALSSVFYNDFTHFCLEHDHRWSTKFNRNECVVFSRQDLTQYDLSDQLSKITHLVMVPVIYDNELWGIMTLVSENYQHHLKPEHVAVLSSVGNAIGGAILRSYEHLALVEAKNAAQKANVAKSAFLANMSHEIRTPMNAIMGFAQMLRKTNLSDDQRDFADVIIDSGYKLLSIINDILDLSNLEVGKTQLALREGSIDQLVTKLWQQYRPIISAKNIEPELILGQSIPILMMDTDKLTRVLNSILSNAVKFTEQGKICFEVSCQHLQNHRIDLTFRITDSGIGISDDKLGAIFNIFEQVDNSITGRYGGMGLGLGLSARIVKMLGGTIEVDSAVNIGTTFTIRIPFEKAKADSTPIMANNYSGRPEIKILIVEDNKINRMLLRKLLEPLKYTLITAENGQIAIDMLKEYPDIKLIIMDVHMPVMSGYLASEKIKADSKTSHIPIIALTASVLKEDIERCREAGMDDFLEKPVQVSRLFGVLEKWLAHKES